MPTDDTPRELTPPQRDELLAKIPQVRDRPTEGGQPQAQEHQEDAPGRIRAVRAYLRIVRQLDLPIDQRMALCREAVPICQRPEEKKLLLEILRRYPTAEGLALATRYLTEAGLQDEAATTAVVIAEQIVSNQPAAVAEAMKQLLQAGGPDQAIARAKQLLQQTQKQ